MNCFSFSTLLVLINTGKGRSNQGFGIVDGATSNYREDGPQRWEVVDRAGDRVRPESDQVSEPAGLQRATAVVLAVELGASNGIELHRRILVNGILSPLDARLQRSPGDHAPE